MLVIESRKQTKTDNIQLRVSINGKQISLDLLSVAELKSLIQQKPPGDGNQVKCRFRGFKKSLQFGDIYLGPDSTVQFNMREKLKYQNCMIRSDGRVYLSKIQCVKLTVKSQSIRFFGQNICKQSLQFFFSQSSEQAQINRKNGTVSSYNGSLKIAKDGKLQTKRLKVSLKTDIFISENSSLKLNDNKSILKCQGSNIKIDFEGKIYGTNQLSIISKTVANKGYLSTKNQQNGAVFINTQFFDNFGHLKFPSLVVMALQMKNHQQAEIQVKNGKIIVERSLENKGLILVPTITVGFSNEGNRAKIENSGSIATKKFLAEGQYCLNTGTICALQINVEGKYEKNLFKNTGIIQSQSLQILNMIFMNSQNASIVSNGQLQIFIEGWINKGQIQNKTQVYASVKGHLSNAGNFQLNQAVLRADTIHNQNIIRANKSLVIDAEDLFKNSKSGSLNMPKLTILANKVKNLGSIQVNELNVKANMMQNSQSGKIKANNANISAKHIYNAGQTTFIDANISAKKLNNQGQFFANNINFTGGYIKNQNKLQANSGEINTKYNLSDTMDAQTIFRNVKMRSKNDDVLYTQGKMKLQNVDLYKCFKHFYNKKQVDFDKVQLTVGGFQVKNLNMKNAHITFTTLKQEENGKITSKGGYNGLHQGERHGGLQKKQNQFEIDIKNMALYQKLSIICEQENQIVIGTTNPYLNGWNLLSHPIAVGEFSKKLMCQNFQIPGNIFKNNLKQKAFKKVTGLSPHLYEKYYGTQVPNTGQTQLTIQTENLLFGGKLKYSGKQLNIQAKQMDLVIGSIQVPDGIIKVNLQQNLFLTHSYMVAKGIQLVSTNQISLQASKLMATASDLLMKASKIIVKPTVQKKHSQTTSRNGKVTWVHDWEEATRCQINVQGNILIRAQEYITMIAPSIKGKKNMLISSPNTYIQGIYLSKQQTIFVKKKKRFGGSKTNTYGNRNDKPLQAILQAEQTIFEGNAKVNATFKGKRLIDLTDNGLQLFYVIGYSGSYENRQFSNFCTQGFEGYSHTRQKFLKANVSQLQQIIRDYNLPGQMIFDTVEWGKIRPTIIGNYKQLIHYPKQWYTSWHQQSIGAPLAMVITMVVAYLGANVLGPALISAAGVAQASMAAMAIKASTSLICSRFLVPLALTGKLDAALKSLFSIDTVIAAATNITLDSLFNVLAIPLGINLTSHAFIDVLKKRFVQLVFNTGVQAIRGQDIGKAFTNGLKGMVSSIMAQVGGNFISQYSGSSGVDYFIHKALHASLGAVQGLISGGNMQSMFSGAVAGVVSEIVIEALVDYKDLLHAFKISDNPQEQFQLQKLIAKIAGGVAGGLCGDFQLAMQVASNAINYNFSAWVEKRLSLITKNDQDYMDTLEKQYEDQVNQMLQDDARQVALAEMAYAADQSIEPYFQQKGPITKQGLEKDKQQHMNAYQSFKKKYPNLTYDQFKNTFPLITKKPVTYQQLQNSQNKMFQNFKTKYPNIKFQSYKIVFDRSSDIQTQMDYFVIKSDVEKKIYIGVAGTRFFGLNHQYDFQNDKMINSKRKALPQRQIAAQNFVRGYAKMNPDYKVVISGHSLGGHLCENAAVKLTKQYKNLWATSVNSYNGWTNFANRKPNQQIINNDRIKRIRINNQWLCFRHGVSNFNAIYQAAKEGFIKKDK